MFYLFFDFLRFFICTILFHFKFGEFLVQHHRHADLNLLSKHFQWPMSDGRSSFLCLSKFHPQFTSCDTLYILHCMYKWNNTAFMLRKENIFLLQVAVGYFTYKIRNCYCFWSHWKCTVCFLPAALRWP